MFATLQLPQNNRKMMKNTDFLLLITSDSMFLSFFLSGEKELTRMQQKVQSTMEDFKEVVDYFQYSGEGEEVMLFTLRLFLDSSFREGYVTYFSYYFKKLKDILELVETLK